MRVLAPALALAAIVASPGAWADGAQEERVRAGLEQRISNAQRYFDEWVARTPDGSTQVTAGVSFASHLPPRRIRELLLDCGCEPLQLYRTIGIVQYGVGGDAGKVLDAVRADRVLGADLAATIEFELTNSPEPKKAERRAIADEALKGRPRFTGISVRATRDGLRKLKRQPDVLAVELSTGRFPLPVDLLAANRPMPRPKP